jgi:lysophospholipase L1-like esterase
MAVPFPRRSVRESEPELPGRQLKLCPDSECPELLLWDQHPNPAGHRQMAETLAQRLRDR